MVSGADARRAGQCCERDAGVAGPVDGIWKNVGAGGEAGIFGEGARGDGGAGGEDQVDASVNANLALGHASENGGYASGGRADATKIDGERDGVADHDVAGGRRRATRRPQIKSRRRLRARLAVWGIRAHGDG
jgi:hypothetical protein